MQPTMTVGHKSGSGDSGWLTDATLHPALLPTPAEDSNAGDVHTGDISHVYGIHTYSATTSD